MKINYLIMSIRFVDAKTKVLFSFKPIVIYFDIKKFLAIFFILLNIINQINQKFKRKKYLKYHKNMP